MRMHDFTYLELFPEINGLSTNVCMECGARVVYHSKHVEWHNKLLP